MKKLLLAFALLVFAAPAAFAGGVHAQIESPAPGSSTYTARMVKCDANTSLEPWAIAEGRVDGKRRSVLIHLTPTSERGVYEFARTWPSDGTWMIRMCVGHPKAPATVATLAADGSVVSNKLYFHTDGSKECSIALRVPGQKDDDC